MNTSVFARLVAKDLYLYRWFALFGTLAGLATLPLMGAGSGMIVTLGVIGFITNIIVTGVFIVMFGLFKERQEKSLLFVLSLPVSPVQVLHWLALVLK